MLELENKEINENKIGILQNLQIIEEDVQPQRSEVERNVPPRWMQRVSRLRLSGSSVMFYGSARTLADFNSIIKEVQPRSGWRGGADPPPAAQILLHHHHH